MTTYTQRKLVVPVTEGGREIIVTETPGTPGAVVRTNSAGRIARDYVEDVVAEHGADIASPAGGTLDLDAATGDLVDVTGTNAITAITLADGDERTVRFTGALTLTHGASLVLPGSANITTVAGDFAVFRGYASAVVRCVSYSPLTRTGTGGLVHAVSPALTTPNLGTPSAGVLTSCTGLPSASVLAPQVRVLSETVTAASLTDGGAAIGTKTLAISVPVGAVLLGMRVVVTAGFAGDTSATLKVGDGSDDDRYMTGTPSIFATAANGIAIGAPSGAPDILTANNPVVTVTSNADITAVLAGGGSMVVSILYLATV